MVIANLLNSKPNNGSLVNGIKFISKDKLNQKFPELLLIDLEKLETRLLYFHKKKVQKLSID